MSESTADFGSDVKVMPSRSAYAVFPLMVDEKLCIKKRNLGYSTRRRTAKSVQVFKLYATDVLRPRSTDCITGLVFRVGFAPTLTLRNIRSFRSVGTTFYGGSSEQLFMEVPQCISLPFRLL